MHRFYGLYYSRVTWWTMVIFTVLHMVLAFFEALLFSLRLVSHLPSCPELNCHVVLTPSRISSSYQYECNYPKPFVAALFGVPNAGDRVCDWGHVPVRLLHGTLLQVALHWEAPLPPRPLAHHHDNHHHCTLSVASLSLLFYDFNS